MRCREASRNDYYVRQERSRIFQEEMEKQQELAKQREMCYELKWIPKENFDFLKFKKSQ